MEITQIHNAIHRIMARYGDDGVVFLYLIKGGRVALVDTGTVDSPYKFIQPALAQIGLALSDIDLILNTHAHLDHIGGNLETKKASNAQIYVHAADLEMAQSTEAQVESLTAPIRTLGLSETEVQQRAGYIRRLTGEAAGADVILQDGDTLDLGPGLVLRVVHNPGHSAGSVSYYWEAERVLLVGDAVQGLGTRPGDTPYYLDAANYRRSLSSLARLDVHVLAMSHAYLVDGYVRDATQTGADVEAFMQDAIRIADTIHNAVAEAIKGMPGASKLEIARAACADLMFSYPLLLVPSTRMPRSAPPTIVAHINAALDGSYPR